MQLITGLFPGVRAIVGTEGIGAGDRFFYYDPDGTLDWMREFPFATIVVKDYEGFDCASNLNRPGVFRLNVGVSSDTYRSLFGPQPSTAAAGNPVDTSHDFSVLDQLLPHPAYAPQSWVCVLNPTEETLESIKPLLAEAYERAVRRHQASRRADPPGATDPG
jgi:hypothetical protein